MDLIKTQSFELAVNTQGDKNSPKVAICLPGRLDTKDYASFVSHLDYLSGKGFFAISFDPPGTWDSPGSTDLFTTTNYIKAVNELIEYYGNKQTLLLGHSRGGATAILAGCLNPNVMGIVAILAAYTDPTPPESREIIDGHVISFRDLPPGDRKTQEQKKFMLSLDYWTDGQKYHPSEVLKTCPKPKLLIGGTDDDFTTPEEVKEIYDSLPDPKMIHILNSDHDYRYHPEVIKEVNEVIGQFLDKYL